MGTFTAYPFDEIPSEVNGLAIPDQAVFEERSLVTGHLAQRMGILFVELSPERSVAVMPVRGNEQPYGLLHGGAYCVLGETLGSYASNLHAGPDRIALGIDINATHTRAARDGWVSAECTAINLGRSVAVHEIVITDARGRRCSTVRITNYIQPRPDGA